jgi:hypothetical protein
MNPEQQAKAPKRDLQGTRPSPLKICRDSHNIRKPQVPPPLPAMQNRQPVIIYTHSPKVIHTEAREFMTLVQRLTGRVNGDADSLPDSRMPSSFSSASSSKQSHTTHALPRSHTAEPGNPNCCRLDSSPSPGGAGLNFLFEEEKFIDSGSNPSEFSGNIGSEQSSVQSLLSPTIQSGSSFPLSPNFFLPSSGLLSPNIFQDFPMYTPQPDYFYSPRHLLCMQSEPHVTPPGRSAMNGVSSLPSPSPTGCDFFNNQRNY